MSAASSRRKRQKDCAATDYTSYLDTTYRNQGDKYGCVPARIMAMYKHPVTQVDMAIVHACRPMMQVNVEKSSVITESWHLQHIVDEVNPDNEDETTQQTRLYPMYNPIRTDKFIDRLRVYMETPSLDDSWNDEESSGHVILVTRRSTHWASSFLSHD